MDVLPTRVDPTSDSYRRNRAHHEALAADLRAVLGKLQLGGPEKARQKHKERGKLLARERIDRLLDPGSPFLELSTLAGHGVYDDDCAAAGVVTGIGLVHGRRVMVVANDATVKGGSYLPLTVKKHVRAQEVAIENGLTTVYLVDSGGAFLPLQADVFPDKYHFGRIFRNQAVLSAASVPQMAVVMGWCTAGGAYVPAMCDEAVIVKGQRHDLPRGPAAREGGHRRGGHRRGPRRRRRPHARQRRRGPLRARRPRGAAHGAVDPLDDRARAAHGFDVIASEDPKHDPDDLLGLLPTDVRTPYDIREVIARLVDGSRFHEFKARYGTTLVTGFARIHGILVGIVANNGVLFSESAQKGAHFVELCCQRGVPLLFLQNVTGFMVGRAAESGRHRARRRQAGAGREHRQRAEDHRDRRRLVRRGQLRHVRPRVLARFLFTWPNARICVMGGEQAAQVMLTVKRDQLAYEGKPPHDRRRRRPRSLDPIRAKYEEEGAPLYGTARLWDDGVIDPRARATSWASPWPRPSRRPVRPPRCSACRVASPPGRLRSAPTPPPPP